MDKLTFITGNAAKADQLGRHLDIPVNHLKIELTEIQSLDLAEIVEHKAKEAYKHIGSPVLIEDTSLTFSALGRLPGPLIKWFLTELDNEGLCRILDGYQDRGAVAEVLFGLYDGKDLQTFRGSAKGSVATKPRGEWGFGWDPIFIPDGYSKTWGEMTADEQKETSMRRIALKKLEKVLKNF
ncbi:MAG: non-canonical purine NTP pyrophosphatase [Patescibacteria group bacterium]